MNPVPPPLPVRVCPKHGLVAGRDGRCVICNRGRADEERAQGNRQVLVWGLVFAGLFGAVLLWRGLRGTRNPAPAAVVETAAPAPSPRPAPDEEAPSVARNAEDRAVARVAAEGERQKDIEAAMHRVLVRMYMVKSCAMCDAAREQMKAKGLTFTEIDVDDPAALEALRKLTPSKQVPVFDVDGEVLVGFGPTNLIGAVRRAAEKRYRRP